MNSNSNLLTNRSAKTFFLTAMLMAISVSVASAAIIVTQVSPWPTAPDLEVIDNTQDDSGVTVSSNRQLTQTFQVASGFTLDKFYIDTATLVASTSFSISIFTVADTNLGAPDAIPTGGPNLLATTVATTPGSLSGTAGILEFNLTGADEIFLAANIGTTGYALQLNTNGTAPFVWLIHESGDGTSGGTIGPDLYADGQAYATVLGGGFSHGNSDYTLAFVAVPEPSSSLLVALGSMALVLRRRR